MTELWDVFIILNICVHKRKRFAYPFSTRTKFDSLVKSLGIVMPDPVSGTGQARSGIQNALNLLDSGFRRNDGKENFSTFYEFIKFGAIVKSID